MGFYIEGEQRVLEMSVKQVLFTWRASIYQLNDSVAQQIRHDRRRDESASWRGESVSRFAMK